MWIFLVSFVVVSIYDINGTITLAEIVKTTPLTFFLNNQVIIFLLLNFLLSIMNELHNKIVYYYIKDTNYEAKKYLDIYEAKNNQDLMNCPLRESISRIWKS